MVTVPFSTPGLQTPGLQVSTLKVGAVSMRDTQERGLLTPSA